MCLDQRQSKTSFFFFKKDKFFFTHPLRALSYQVYHLFLTSERCSFAYIFESTESDILWLFYLHSRESVQYGKEHNSGATHPCLHGPLLGEERQRSVLDASWRPPRLFQYLSLFPLALNSSYGPTQPLGWQIFFFVTV